jgi:phosphatidylserine/phosphatidylglycerophosphate/cardiolipin synthase-like enzyme
MILPATLPEVIHELVRLADEESWSASQIAYLLDSIRSSKADDSVFSHLFELVLSGPSTDAVHTRDTGAVYSELIETAKEEVILASYAIYNGQELFTPLIRKHDKIEGFQTRLYLDIPRRQGDTTVDEMLIARYRQDFFTKQWKSERTPELYYFAPSLERDWKARASMHAKLVIVDRSTVFLSSANLTKAAQTKNIEVGGLIWNESTARRLADHFSSLTESGSFRPF